MKSEMERNVEYPEICTKTLAPLDVTRDIIDELVEMYPNAENVHY